MRAHIDLNYNEPCVVVGTLDVADKLEQIAAWLRERSVDGDYSQHGNLLAYGDHGHVIGNFAFDQSGGNPAPANTSSKLYKTVEEANAGIVEYQEMMAPSLSQMFDYVIVPEAFKNETRYKIMVAMKSA
jgi:hypothetical protein